jgi:menaquinone reductase, multiheme cytochrome c subunit
MLNQMQKKVLLFPAWVDKLARIAAVLVVGGLVYTVVLVAYATSPTTTSTGYQPKQPVPYSHALHAGQLGIDCRYCHIGAERGAFAVVPPTEVCMNCHTRVRATSDKLAPVRESFATGLPVEWVRVHDLPDFVYFNHSAHVTRGIGCVTCHGRIDKMEEVYQFAPLNMGWCLECHKNPEKYLRPKEFVTKMDWEPDGDQLELGRRLKEEYGINPSTDCYTCHR